jgi:hypothetical protein
MTKQRWKNGRLKVLLKVELMELNEEVDGCGH